MTPEQQVQFDSLTRLQQKLVLNLVSGMPKREAYLAAGGRARGENIRSCVAEILAKPDVSLLLSSLNLMQAEKALITAEGIVQRLIEEAGLNTHLNPESMTPATRLAALKLLTDYTGGFDKNKTKMEVGASTASYKPISLEVFINGAGRDSESEP